MYDLGVRPARMSKPSSVLDDHLSQVPEDLGAASPWCRLSTFARLGEPPSCAGGPEIAAGRIALFTPPAAALVSVALTAGCGPACRSGLSGPERATGPCPRFREAPCSMQLGLSSSGEPPAVILSAPAAHSPLARLLIIPDCGRRRKTRAQKSAAGRIAPRRADGARRGLVRGQGFEPQFSAPKAGVLPLDDPRVRRRTG